MTEPRQKLWRFDADALLPGDVVLEAGSTPAGQGIRIAEWGRFSHALIWLGDGNFLEAVGIGARAISFKRVIVDDRKRWAVLRTTDDSGAGELAAKEARGLAHLSYDLKGALGTKISLLRHEDRTRLFCSQLVAEAYQRAGHPLVDGLQPNQVTPKRLHTGSKLKVIDHTFIELGEYDVPNVDRDAAYGSSLTNTDLVISKEAVAAGARCLPQGSAAPGNLQQLYETLGQLTQEQGKPVSDALLEVFESSGYFQLIEDQEGDICKWVEAEIAAVLKMPSGNRALVAKEFSALAKAFAIGAERHAELLKCFSNAFSHTGLPVWQALAECHARRSELFKRLEQLAARGLAAAA